MAKELVIGVVIGAALKAGFTTVFGRAEHAAKALGGEIQKATVRQNRLLNSMTKGLSSRHFGKMVDGYYRLGRAIDKAAAAQTRLNQSLDRHKAAAEYRKGLRSEMAETAAHAAVAAAPVIASVRKFAEQEAASADLKIAMMRKDGGFGRFAEIDKLTTAWGAQLPGNKTDYTQMALGLKSQGISDATIINGGGLATARLNTVMGIPIADGSFFAKNMEAHGIKERELLKSADLTQRAYFAAGLKKEDMFEAMKYYSGKANTIGYTGLEHQKKIYAVEGMAATKGIEGSQFGTNFSTFLGNLSKGVENLEYAGSGRKGELRRMMESADADFNFFNKDGSIKDLRQITGILESEFGKIRAKYGDRGVMDISNAVFGSEGGRVADILIQGGVKAFDEMTAKMDAQASLQERIKVKTGTLSAALEALGGTVENAAAAFGEVFAPDIKAFAASAQKLLDGWIVPFVKNNKWLVKSVAGVLVGFFGLKLMFLGLAYSASMAAMPFRSLFAAVYKFAALKNLFGLLRLRGLNRSTALLRTFGMSAAGAAKLGAVFGRIGTAFGGLFARIAAGGGLFGKLGVVFGVLRTAVLSLGRALLATPIGWIAAALAAAAFLIYKYWRPIKAFFLGFWDGLTAAFKPVLPLFDGLAAALGRIWETVRPVLQPVLDWLGEFFSLTQESEGGARGFGETVGSVIGGILAAVVETGAMIVDGWRMIFDTLFGAADAAWTEIKTAFDGGLSGILALIVNWSPLGAFYSAFAAVMGWFGIELPAKFTGFGQMLLDGLVNGIKSKVDAVIGTVTSLVNRIKSAFTGPVAIHSPSRVFKSYGGYLMEGLQLGIGAAAGRPLAAVQSVAGRLKQRFTAGSGLSAEMAASIRTNADEFAAARQNQAAGGGITVHFNPTINAPGGDPQQIQAALRLGLQEFETMYRRMMAEIQRRAY